MTQNPKGKDPQEQTTPHTLRIKRKEMSLLVAKLLYEDSQMGIPFRLEESSLDSISKVLATALRRYLQMDTSSGYLLQEGLLTKGREIYEGLCSERRSPSDGAPGGTTPTGATQPDAYALLREKLKEEEHPQEQPHQVESVPGVPSSLRVKADPQVEPQVEHTTRETDPNVVAHQVEKHTQKWDSPYREHINKVWQRWQADPDVVGLELGKLPKDEDKILEKLLARGDSFLPIVIDLLVCSNHRALDQLGTEEQEVLPLLMEVWHTSWKAIIDAHLDRDKQTKQRLANRSVV